MVFLMDEVETLSFGDYYLNVENDKNVIITWLCGFGREITSVLP